ncbi:MAG: hypothetical protein MUF51_07350 [Vicinamibacteria bacterium]|jgi:hypothetical protein|nr:hypothetical protein [Vicinamibacteria bacterium]
MICIRCGRDSKARERLSGKCPQCHGQFAFDRGDTFTDKAFQSAVDAVSAEGHVRWHKEHLFYELCRRRRKKIGRMPLGCAVFAALAALLLFVIAISSSSVAPFVFAVLLAAAAIAAWINSRAQTAAIDQKQFEKWWLRFNSVHGQPKSLIVRREAPPVKKRPAEADLADYSFDRAVICDRAATVDLLLANNFHFENNCAVLSHTGYPAGPFEMVRTMLKRNPRLHVFALHDATPEGCRMAYRLAHDPAWFHGHVPVTDVGLRPRHAGPFRGLYLNAQPGSVHAGGGLTGDEAQWLSRYRLELFAIRPEQILKRLFRALNRKSDQDDDQSVWTSGDSTGGNVDYDSDSFGVDASDSDGGADSFG